jgi:hypothetical protein
MRQQFRSSGTRPRRESRLRRSHLRWQLLCQRAGSIVQAGYVFSDCGSLHANRQCRDCARSELWKSSKRVTFRWRRRFAFVSSAACRPWARWDWQVYKGLAPRARPLSKGLPSRTWEIARPSVIADVQDRRDLFSERPRRWLLFKWRSPEMLARGGHVGNLRRWRGRSRPRREGPRRLERRGEPRG